VPGTNQMIVRCSQYFRQPRLQPALGDARLYDDMSSTIAYHRAHASQNYTDHIALTADTDASYNTIVKILDAAREAKDDDVGFVTE